MMAIQLKKHVIQGNLRKTHQPLDSDLGFLIARSPLIFMSSAFAFRICTYWMLAMRTMILLLEFHTRLTSINIIILDKNE